MKRKGQFFIIGAVFVVILFFMGIPAAKDIIRSPSGDIGLFSDNLIKEFPKALNFGLNESSSYDSLVNFSRFSRTVSQGLFLGYGLLWVVSNRTGTNDLNVTIGNFLGSDVNVTLNSTVVLVPDNSTNSTTFSSVASEFNLNISFNSEVKEVNWPRDKINLYAFLKLTRDKDIIKKEVSA